MISIAHHSNGRQRVLVTGASGFVGGHLVQRLANEGMAVTALVRPRSRIAHLPLDRITLVCGDLRDIESLRRAVKGVDLIVHAGAATRGEREEHEQSTVVGTRNVLEAGLEANVRRFVHISSLAVYGAIEPDRDVPIDEELPGDPDPERVGPYAWAKSEAEKHARDFHERGLPTVILRPGLIYGPRQHCRPVLPPHVGYHVPGFGGRLFMMIGDGGNLLPLTYIDNVLDAVVLAARSEVAAGKTYNIVDEEPVTQRQYLSRCIEMGGGPQVVVPVPISVLLCAAAIAERVHRLGCFFKGAASNGGAAANGGPPTAYRLKHKFRSIRASALKARAQLGWSPRIGFEEGVRRMFSDSSVG
jgi:2-alkyl-3-oxoalkanoate reductase